MTIRDFLPSALGAAIGITIVLILIWMILPSPAPRDWRFTKVVAGQITRSVSGLTEDQCNAIFQEEAAQTWGGSQAQVSNTCSGPNGNYFRAAN